MQKLLFLLLAFVVPGTVLAQTDQKKDKHKSPVADTVRVFHFAGYRFDENLRRAYYRFDTLFESQQVYSPLEQITPSWTRQTNLGQGAISNEYFRRSEWSDFLFWRPYEMYWDDPARTAYYRLSSPLTRIDFSKAQKTSGNEQTIDLMHARNFSEKLNVGIRYHVISTPGLKGQRNRARHSRFAGQVAYDGLRYRLHAHGASTRIETQHNGGFVDGKYAFEKDSVDIYLTTAGDLLHDWFVWADQEWLLGPTDSLRIEGQPTRAVVNAWASLRHHAEYRRSYRYFVDSRLVEQDVPGWGKQLYYYPNAFFSRTATSDSLHFSQLKNSVDLEMKEGLLAGINFGLRVGLMHELNWVYNFTDYVFTDLNTNTFGSAGARAALFNRVSDFWAWNANAEYYVQGYRQNDLRLAGELNRYFYTKTDSSYIRLRAELTQRRPNFFLNQFESNHYRWHNDFVAEQRLDASLHYHDPRLRLYLSLDARQQNNWVYIGTDGQPAQTNEPMLTWAVALRKRFVWRHWGWDNVLIYQKTSHAQWLHLPSWIAYQSLYYDRSLFKDALRLQVGADLTINERFQADFFNPAVGLYQLQTEKRVGEFPYVSAFVNLRIRNARLFFKFSNLYQSINNEWNFVSPYTIDSYSMFRFGVNWYFVD